MLPEGGDLGPWHFHSTPNVYPRVSLCYVWDVVVPKGSGPRLLLLRVAVLRGGGIFRRWGLMEGNEVTEGTCRKGVNSSLGTAKSDLNMNYCKKSLCPLSLSVFVCHCAIACLSHASVMMTSP